VFAGCSKDLRGEAREKSTSAGVLTQYVVARRLSATKHMSLFQQPAKLGRFLALPQSHQPIALRLVEMAQGLIDDVDSDHLVPGAD
jgi:hypothetical protein